jgi:hypothetical protein
VQQQVRRQLLRSPTHLTKSCPLDAVAISFVAYTFPVLSYLTICNRRLQCCWQIDPPPIVPLLRLLLAMECSFTGFEQGRQNSTPASSAVVPVVVPTARRPQASASGWMAGWGRSRRSEGKLGGWRAGVAQGAVKASWVDGGLGSLKAQ